MTYLDPFYSKVADNKELLTLLRSGMTSTERIASVSSRTGANRYMVGDSAFSSNSAGTRARISTLEANTGQRWSAVLICLAFSSAARVWIPLESSQAGTGSDSITVLTFSVSTAGWWEARVSRFRSSLSSWKIKTESDEIGNSSLKESERREEKSFQHLTCDRGWLTRRAGISNVALRTSTDRVVVNNTTLGLVPTRTRARVDTFLIPTSEVAGTLCVYDTLWPTIGWIPDVIR